MQAYWTLLSFSARSGYRVGRGELRAWSVGAAYRQYLVGVLPWQTPAFSVAFDAGWDTDDLEPPLPVLVLWVAKSEIRSHGDSEHLAPSKLDLIGQLLT